MSKAVKKVINILIDIVVVIILIISLFIVVISITSKSSGIPNIFGYAPLSVMSDSMSPTFEEGDMIISRQVDPSSINVEVGDVVTFPFEIEGQNVYNTHRVVEIIKDDGITYYKTQGDNKTTNPEPDTELQNVTTVKAVWTGARIPNVGRFLNFIRTQLGFFLVILLPMILFFVYEAIRVVMNIIAYNKEKAAEEAAAAVANSDLTEEQKQRAIEEYLAKQKAQESETAVQTPADGGSSDAES